MASEKTYAPSTRKKREARKRGEVAKSSLLSPTIILGTLPLLGFAFSELFQALILLMEKCLSEGADFHTKDLLLSAQQYGLAVGGWTFLVLIACGAVALLAETLQVGFHVIPGQLWQVQKLHLVKGLQQLCSVHSPQSWLVTGIRLFILLGLWLCICWVTFSRYVTELVAADIDGLGVVTVFGFDAICELFLLMAGSAGLIAFADYLYARFALLKRLRMDREELKQEFKDTEGSPEMQAMRKQLHAELVAQESVASVRSSKVVIVD